MELKKLILVHGMDTMTMSRFTNAGHVVVPVYNENGPLYCRHQWETGYGNEF